MESGDWRRILADERPDAFRSVSGVILAAGHRFDVDALRRKVQILKSGGVAVWVEVCSLEEAKQAERFDADGVVLCGLESGGLCGEESGLVLLGRVQREVGLSAVVRGGMGPDAAAAVMACGASGYVLEEALWLCEGMAPSPAARKVLERVGATDTRCLGVTLGARYRAWSLLATRPTRELAAQEVEFLEGGDARGYLAEVEARVFGRWEELDPKREIWPMGQGAALARVFYERYGTVERAVRGVQEHVTEVMGGLAADFPLREGAGVARVNGTRFPIHQGPMAQVSDTPGFARAVVEAGALPWLALGNMPTEVARRVVDETANALGAAPFGAGIIGLEANPYRDGHIEMMIEQGGRRGNFSGLVAAGSAEQAMMLEAGQVPSYLHTPTPGVLAAALRQGHRRFIWEGAEAGGHVGTLGSLALWQLGVIAMEEALAGGEAADAFAVVVAGGISGAASAAAAAAMLFGLHRRGVAVGVQMGTAYLMCREAVESGAVSATYQEMADHSPGTVIMGETVNTPTRVLMSPAARWVLGREVERLAEGIKLGERKHLYERDNLGGLRAAAKSQRIAEVVAGVGARFETLSREEQLEAGLFHCGQGVVLCQAQTIAQLHEEVTEGARRWVEARLRRSWDVERLVRVPGDRVEVLDDGVPGERADIAMGCQAMAPASQERTMTTSEGAGMRHSTKVEAIDGERAVAIIGIGAKMPGALSAMKFWENILFGVSAIKEVPADRWDPALYFDEDPGVPDKTYSKIGGWVEGFEFDRRRYRMPPKVVASVDPTQLLCLEAVHDALEDAGYLERTFDRDRCAVILGNALGGDLRDESTLRILYPKMDQALRGALMELSSAAMGAAERERLLEEVEARFKATLGEVSEDSMPGELANVIAGRVAQVFDLRGPNFVTDAACASSLAAIEAAVRGLRAKEYDMVVCGGADRSMGPTSFVKFSKIGALSPDGSRPFDAGANGFVMGEGAGIVVLKRLSDAVADGDQIYAVIRGVGGSSDGKGKAITAPNPAGQRRALERAYHDAGVGPRSVSLIEAHGTSTPVGDPAEVASLRAVLDADGGEWAAETVALGSVKSMIGHLKSAAGAAGVIKVAMALKHRVLPPTLGVEEVNSALELEGSRVRVQTEAQPWEVYEGQARRAGVSAFGFGGTNFHVVLEEFEGGAGGPGARRSIASREHGSEVGGPGEAVMLAVGGEVVALEERGGARGASACGALEERGGAREAVPPGEGVLGLWAASKRELEEEITRAQEHLERGGIGALTPWLLPVREQGAGLRQPVRGAEKEVRLAIAFEGVDELRARLERARNAAERDKGWRVLAHQGIVLGERVLAGKVGMLFPGQGTQYLGMLSELKSRFDVVRRTFEEADEVMMPVIGRRLSDVIDPGPLGDAAAQKAAFEALTQTEITQPAVLTADIALYRLLGRLGIAPHVVAGHSLGEYGACVAAGIMSFGDALRTVAARGTEMARVTPMNGDTGLMAGINAAVEVVQPVLDGIDGYVVCANINCPTQTIIAGLREPVRRAVETFEAMGYQAPLLPVSHAFHSEVVAAASGPLRRHLATIEVNAPATPILTNVTGGFYPEGPGAEDAIRDLLAEQVAAPVEYIKVVETMYAAGARVFVEVGPKRAQTSFVSSILEGREHLAVHTNHPKKGDVASLYEALATMWASGVWRPECDQELAAVWVSGERAVVAVPVPGERVEAAGAADQLRVVPVPGERSESACAADQLRDAPVPGERVEAEGGGSVDRASIDAELLRVLCEQTGYEPEEIEQDFELEADLGVDTVKQAEIMARVRELYGLARDESFRLSEYPTLGRMGDYVEARLSEGGVPGERVEAACAADQLRDAPVPGERVEAACAADQLRDAPVPGERVEAEGAGSVDRASIDAELLRVLCEQTGYEPEEIEQDFELEADLGVDTVKQAEIMARVRELYGLARDESFRLSEYPTLGRMGDYVEARLSEGGVPGERVEAACAADQLRDAPVPGERVEAEGAGSVDRASIDAELLRVLCEQTGYEPEEIEQDFELEADLGVDTVKQAEIMARVRELYGLARDESFRLSEYPTLGRMGDYVEARLSEGRVPGERSESTGSDEELRDAPVPGERTEAERADAAVPGEQIPRVSLSDMRPYTPHRHAIAADVEITGCAAGLPGAGAIFRSRALDELLAGDNMIGQVPQKARQAMVDNHIVRLQKHEGGGGEMRPVTELEEVIKLAGVGGEFDLGEWGVPERLRASLDRTSQLAFAAGFEALRDAGLPLVPRYRETTTGKRVTIGWALPKAVGRETGVIFASAFAGQDALIEELRAQREHDYRFNHRFLLRVLGIANSRFAEFVGARGPNTKINNACASTTTAVAMAQDWIRAGRCRRVLILAADDASGDTLMEWVGSGFLATGAATTEDDVARAALPFDRRRHGMIIGMGALALVVEEAGQAEARGIEPVADVLATRFVNSAYHPTRLDVDHIAGEVAALVKEVEGRFELKREEIADRTVFISHETYTPARGGSAAAEIAALRQTFGERANQVVIANTKGFTGHAMAAGIEDVLAMKVLQRQQVPPIANFAEPDPELGDLRLSQGGSYPVDYALRLAAGFGSQLALALFRYRARCEARVFAPARYRAWLSEVSEMEHFELALEDRVLRLRPARPMDPPRGPGQTQTRVPALRAEAVASAAGLQATSASSFAMRPVAIEASAAPATDVLGIRRELAGRGVALVGGPVLVAELLRRLLERAGARVVRLASDRQRGPLDEKGVNLGDEDEILRLFAAREVDAVINLLGVGSGDDEAAEVYWAARHTFHVARAFAALHEDRSSGTVTDVRPAFVSLTLMGGCFGLSPGDSPSVAGGAVSGFTKALAKEWEWAQVKVVDAPGALDEGMATRVLEELVGGSDRVEVGLAEGMRHRPVVLEPEDVRAPSGSCRGPDADSVILVTGGARGITAEVCVDLARRFGCALALVGRTPLDHPDPLSVDLKQEAVRVKAELKAAGKRVTPVAVRRELRGLVAQQEIARNLGRMRQVGARAQYFSCDVAEAAGVQALIGQVEQELGPVTGVIHGAGVEDSRLLGAKDVAAFDRVFRGKALGGVNLWRALRDRGLRHYVAFTSVAGRFGNAGQTDYAAANDALARQVMRINAFARQSGRPVQALAIDWTAWDEVGMAVEGSMRTILEARGVEFLPPAVGAPMVGESLARGLTGEFVVAGELGALGGEHKDRSPGTVTPMPRDRSPGTVTPMLRDRSPGTVTSYALVDRVVAKSRDEVSVERIFDPQRDLFLRDHRYQGSELVPGVMGYELMSAAAMELSGEPVAELRDVRFERALKLAHSEPIRAMAVARVVAREAGRVEVEVVVRSEREARTGRMIRQEHFRARVICGAAPEMPSPVGECGGVGGDAPRWCQAPDRDAIYRRFFHTGSFQLLESGGLHHDDAIVAFGRLTPHRLMTGAKVQRWVSEPLVRELAMQSVGLWGLLHHQRTFLPLGIGRSVTLGTSQPGELLTVRAKRRADASADTIAFDVEVRGEDGRRLQVMEKVEMIAHSPLASSDRLAPGGEARFLEVGLSAEMAGVLLSRAGQSEEAVLTASEREARDRLRSEQRRGEWLAARVAARELLRRYALCFYGERVGLEEVFVHKTDDGEPQLCWRDASRAWSLPALSLTHASGRALAVVTMPGSGERIGVDMEPLEARSEAFGRAYFTEQERALGVGELASGQRETALWTIKEAVSKALGVGLQLAAAEIEVVSVSPRPVAVPGDRTCFEARVRLCGKAEERRLELDIKTPAVELKLQEGAVVSIARALPEDLIRAPGRERVAGLPKGKGYDRGSGTGAGGNAVRTPGTEPLSGGMLDDEGVAAIAALLRHRGLWEQTSSTSKSPSATRSLSSWKA
ncbi:hypothetical protein DL240_07030 [Lujinxingia litoralis]|uniref:SDR family NAD(P)-dependent oxidoreductase n=1 Tax=Lujinxingia litoralis TaxID=2211119 RepID=A0A328C7H5_9DELT|nr:type I polyketide synthase [Lujinxingia litoralis]RAL23895.1 hypothetical protein DL240_07030 [Lujinxingia litoralis]